MVIGQGHGYMFDARNFLFVLLVTVLVLSVTIATFEAGKDFGSMLVAPR